MRSMSGTGHRERGAEHEPGRDLLRHLVDRARAVDVAAAERLQERAVVQHGPEVVRVRVPEVRGDGVVAVRGTDRAETVGRSPRTPRPTSTSCHVSPRPDHRRAHAVGIALELLDRGALRAEVAVAEDVVAIAAHERDLAVVEVQLETARRLAEVARAVRDVSAWRASLRVREPGATAAARDTSLPDAVTVSVRCCVRAATRAGRIPSRSTIGVRHRPCRHRHRLAEPRRTRAVQDHGPRPVVVGRFDAVRASSCGRPGRRARGQRAQRCRRARGSTNADRPVGRQRSRRRDRRGGPRPRAAAWSRCRAPRAFTGRSFGRPRPSDPRRQAPATSRAARRPQWRRSPSTTLARAGRVRRRCRPPRWPRRPGTCRRPRPLCGRSAMRAEPVGVAREVGQQLGARPAGQARTARRPRRRCSVSRPRASSRRLACLTSSSSAAAAAHDRPSAARPTLTDHARPSTSGSCSRAATSRRDDPIARQMVNFVYLLGDRETGEAVAIDPPTASTSSSRLLDADGMRLTGVLATHYHPDHVGGAHDGLLDRGHRRAARPRRRRRPRCTCRRPRRSV